LRWGGLLSATPSNYRQYLQYVAKAKSHPWKRAIFIDQLLADLFVKSVCAHQTNFATLFLNAAAHIQHHYLYHYLFSSAVYNGAMRNPDWYIHPDQDPHPKITYYWRIRDHAAFLKKIGGQYKNVEPCMSRDFLLTCESTEAAQIAEARFNAALTDDSSRFFEVDNRGSDLFVTLVYTSDITKTTCFSIEGQNIPHFFDDVAFVAIKNGEHNGIGSFADSNALNTLKGT
jgi:hypothetical protein